MHHSFKLHYGNSKGNNININMNMNIIMFIDIRAKLGIFVRI